MTVTDPRAAAATAALLAPELVPIGEFFARKFSGGDMLLAQSIGLVLASGDEAATAAMSPAAQSAELLQIGALLCHSPKALALALWKSRDALRADFIAPVLFALSAAETNALIAHVATFFARAAAVNYELEEKPSDGASGPQPAGK